MLSQFRLVGFDQRMMQLPKLEVITFVVVGISGICIKNGMHSFCNGSGILCRYILAGEGINQVPVTGRVKAKFFS